MSRAHRRHRAKWFVFIALPLLALASVVGLEGCFRHRWHDPERLESRMAWVTEDVAEHLELRPDQQPGFDALAEKVKTLVRQRVSQMRDSMAQLRDQINAETVDADRVAALVKEHLRQKMPVQQQEALVDDFLAFYKTLSPEQQAIVKERAAKHLERHF